MSICVLCWPACNYILTCVFRVIAVLEMKRFPVGVGSAIVTLYMKSLHLIVSRALHLLH